MEFEQYCAAIEQQFELVIEQGTDQDVFCSGYLHGHFSLVLAKLSGADVDSLRQAMLDSLQTAFAQGELEPQDQQDVLAFWQQIQPA